MVDGEGLRGLRGLRNEWAVGVVGRVVVGLWVFI